MATSRINEVKAPQHFKTPRSGHRNEIFGMSVEGRRFARDERLPRRQPDVHGASIAGHDDAIRIFDAEDGDAPRALALLEGATDGVPQLDIGLGVQLPPYQLGDDLRVRLGSKYNAFALELLAPARNGPKINKETTHGTTGRRERAGRPRS